MELVCNYNLDKSTITFIASHSLTQLVHHALKDRGYQPSGYGLAPSHTVPGGGKGDAIEIKAKTDDIPKECHDLGNELSEYIKAHTMETPKVWMQQ